MAAPKRYIPYIIGQRCSNGLVVWLKRGPRNVIWVFLVYTLTHTHMYNNIFGLSVRGNHPHTCEHAPLLAEHRDLDIGICFSVFFFAFLSYLRHGAASIFFIVIIFRGRVGKLGVLCVL